MNIYIYYAGANLSVYNLYKKLNRY